MKAVVAAFNQEKALVGVFSVITNLRMELFEALIAAYSRQLGDHLFWLQSPTFRADTGHHRPLQPATPLTITAVLLVCFALSISLLQDRLKQ